MKPIPTAVAHPCEESALAGAVEAANRESSSRSWLGPRQDRSHGQIRGNRSQRLPNRRRSAQPRIGGKGGRTGSHGAGRTSDEGQPAHRRTAGGGRLPRRRAADRPPHQPRLRDGRSHLSQGADRHRRRDQHCPTLEDKVDICQNAIDLAISLGREKAQSRDSRRGRNGNFEDAGHDRCGGALQDGRAGADHRRHSRRPTGVRQRDQQGGGAKPRAFTRRSPAIRTSFSRRIWKPETSSPSNSASWPMPTAPGWCSAHECRSS